MNHVCLIMYFLIYFTKTTHKSFTLEKSFWHWRINALFLWKLENVQTTLVLLLRVVASPAPGVSFPKVTYSYYIFFKTLYKIYCHLVIMVQIFYIDANIKIIVNLIIIITITMKIYTYVYVCNIAISLANCVISLTF